MTPDESAWTTFREEMGRRGHQDIAGAVDHVLHELRKRRETGAFGPQVYENERGNLDADLSRLAPMEYGRKTYADIQRERDAQRVRAEAAERERDDAQEALLLAYLTRNLP